jgi:hypothetical protein
LQDGLPRLFVRGDHAVFDPVLEDILSQVDDRIARVDHVVYQPFHLSTMIQAGEEGKNDLVIAHVRFSEYFQEVGLAREKVNRA